MAQGRTACVTGERLLEFGQLRLDLLERNLAHLERAEQRARIARDRERRVQRRAHRTVGLRELHVRVLDAIDLRDVRALHDLRDRDFVGERTVEVLDLVGELLRCGTRPASSASRSASAAVLRESRSVAAASRSPATSSPARSSGTPAIAALAEPASASADADRPSIRAAVVPATPSAPTREFTGSAVPTCSAVSASPDAAKAVHHRSQQLHRRRAWTTRGRCPSRSSPEDRALRRRDARARGARHPPLRSHRRRTDR